ncbi:MAG TPA: aldose 1-epimerase [Ramlibacter sp.]|nr:aldose 1-epimerase [Ramlibacter sp.]
MSLPTEALTDALLQMSAGELRVAITPDVGGSIASFRTERKGGAIDWLRPASEEGLAARNPLAMASFPLVPFCNRIRNGRAIFEGREIRFPPNHPAEQSPHPLHGIGWQLPWHVASASHDEVRLFLRMTASRAWPWSFSSTLRYHLTASRLEVEIAITNDDSAPMPAGIGHHPYFPWTPGTRITSPCTAMWKGDAEAMPTGIEETEAVRKLREGTELRDLELDNNFTGWQHRTLIEWPASAAGPERMIVMEAQPPLDYFVLYCPHQYDFFCAEPVSQCTDWLNMIPRYGQRLLGGARVEPGGTLNARFALTPHAG